MIVNINEFLEKSKNGELIKESRNKKVNDLLSISEEVSYNTKSVLEYLKYLRDAHRDNHQYLEYIIDYTESFGIDIPNGDNKNYDKIGEEIDGFTQYLENLAKQLTQLELDKN